MLEFAFYVHMCSRTSPLCIAGPEKSMETISRLASLIIRVEHNPDDVHIVHPIGICQFYYLTNNLNFRRFILTTHCHSDRCPLALLRLALPVRLEKTYHARLVHVFLSSASLLYIPRSFVEHVCSSISIIKSIDSDRNRR